jgi:hypothetical protein
MMRIVCSEKKCISCFCADEGLGKGGYETVKINSSVFLFAVLYFSLALLQYQHGAVESRNDSSEFNIHERI